MFEKLSTVAALLRIAEAIETYNEMYRYLHSLPAPGEVGEADQASVTVANDEDSWALEQEEERRNRDF